MTTLTRWNPFKSTGRFDPMANIDDIIHNMATRSLWRDMDVAPEMRLDVAEDDKSYTIKAEIPGVDKNDIEISVEGNQVAISAEVKRETTRKDEQRELCTERYYGKVYRSFALPSELDSTKADAHYEHGVLTLTLPKRGNGSSRRITVS